MSNNTQYMFQNIGSKGNLFSNYCEIQTSANLRITFGILVGFNSLYMKNHCFELGLKCLSLNNVGQHAIITKDTANSHARHDKWSSFHLIISLHARNGSWNVSVYAYSNVSCCVVYRTYCVWHTSTKRHIGRALHIILNSKYLEQYRLTTTHSSLHQCTPNWKFLTPLLAHENKPNTNYGSAGPDG
jgi:hypothetical protein